MRNNMNVDGLQKMSYSNVGSVQMVPFMNVNRNIWNFKMLSRKMGLKCMETTHLLALRQVKCNDVNIIRTTVHSNTDCQIHMNVKYL